MKSKLAYLAIIVAISLILLCAAYIIFHMNCSTAHLAKHIRLGMTYDQVVKLVGEPDWAFQRDMQFDLDNGNSIMVFFDSQADKLNTATVYGFSFSKLPKAEIGLIVGAASLVCAIVGAVAILISRKRRQPTAAPKDTRQWFISRKSTLAYIAIVISISLMLLIVASIIFHTNCGTAHLARHVRHGMSYHELVKLLGEPISINNAMNTATYKLQDGNFFRVYLWADMKIPDAQWEDQVIVHGYSYDKALPMAEIGLIVGAALLVCAIGGTAAILISRKLKQPTA